MVSCIQESDVTDQESDIFLLNSDY